MLPPLPEKPVAAGTKIIILPEPELLPDIKINFLELIELRSSVREYSQESLTLKELSFLLWCTQGVKMGLPDCASIRNVPSAGARHSLETYLFINRVEGIKAGLYRYLPFEHALLPLDGVTKNDFLSPFKAKQMLAQSAVTFVWTTVIERMSYKFSDRAARYVLLDAGHVCQNLYLAAQALKLGACAVGTFADEKLNEILSIDGVSEYAIYAATVGKRL